MLAISLHAARQELRDELTPGMRAFPLPSRRAELTRYDAVTGKCVVVQYLMLDGINDGDENLEALESFCSGLDATMSLLRFNQVKGILYSPSTFGRMALWSMELNQRGFSTAVNRPRGTDIVAACGQLANRTSEQELYS